jgi:hypothetical protein
MTPLFKEFLNFIEINLPESLEISILAESGIWKGGQGSVVKGLFFLQHHELEWFLLLHFGPRSKYFRNLKISLFFP